MTKKQAAKAYLKIYKDLRKLHMAASNHISRKDNNWQFEISFKMREVARRILKEYDLPLDDPYFKE